MSKIVVDRDKKQREKYSSLLSDLDNLYELYEILHAERKKNGLIDFSSIESRFVFNNPNEIARCGCGERFSVANR